MVTLAERPSKESLMRAARIAFILFLAFALPASTFADLPQAAGQDSSSAVSLLEAAAHFLAELWNKIGCHIDPDGLCQSSQTDIGCHIDPDGRCRG
jgi:hypothetical protein